MVRKALDAVDGLRERKKQRTREAIVDAALDLFERQGFDATTVEDIAAAAEVSPRTFFRYFDSKLDVVMSHTKEAREAEHPPFADLAHAAPEKGPVTATHEMVRELVATLFTPEGSDASTMLRELKVAMTTPSLRALALEHFHDDHDEMTEAYAARLGLDPNSLKPRLLAGVVATTLWAVLDRWVADGADPDRLGPMVDEAFALLASGFDRSTPDRPAPDRPASD
ncbi:MAG TPA: TetR family transcriptional regulator [Acidimicrobiales bacterium]